MQSRIFIDLNQSRIYIYISGNGDAGRAQKTEQLLIL